MVSSDPSNRSRTIGFCNYGKVEKALFLVVMLNSGSVFQAVFDRASLVFMIAFDALLLYKLMDAEARRFRLVGISILLLLIGLFLGTMIKAGDFASWPQYLYYANMYFGAFCVAYLFGFRCLASLFDWFMIRVAVVSLIGYMVFEVIGATPFGIAIHNRDVVYDCYLAFARISGVSHRISGFFWEPGQFAIYLIFAIFMYIRVMDGRCMYRLIVYFIALVLTFSAMAYAVIPILLLVVLSIYLNVKDYRRLSVGVLILVLCGAIFGAEMFEQLFGMMPGVFGKVATRDASFMTRINGAIVDFELFRTSPLWGIGLGRCEELAYNLSRITGSAFDARTSTFTTWLMTFGAPASLVMTGLLLHGWLRNCSCVIESILFGLVLVFVYTSQPMMLSLFSAAVAFSSFERSNPFWRTRRQVCCPV